MRSGQFPLGPFVRIPVRRVQIPPPPPHCLHRKDDRREEGADEDRQGACWWGEEAQEGEDGDLFVVYLSGCVLFCKIFFLWAFSNVWLL